MKERITWKTIYINDIKTHYEVSDIGYIRNIDTDKILKSEITNNGYKRVTIYIKNVPYKKSVHRLVALAFIPNPDDLPFVNHKDGNKQNNELSNLEWVTPSENNLHAYEHGLYDIKYGDMSHLAKYTRKSVIKACEYMESGIFTIIEISKLTGIDNAMLYMIKNRKSWLNVSKYYDVENCKSIKCEYDENQMSEVFHLLSTNEYSIYDIMDKTGVRSATIQSIIDRRYTKYKFLYDVFDVNKYNPKDHITLLPKWILEWVKSEIISGVDAHVVAKQISEKYKFNYDSVYAAAARLRYKHSKKVQRLSKA